MKMLFKLYLLVQLIALPFMVGAIGGALGGSDPSSSSNQAQAESVIDISALDALASQNVAASTDLCDAVQGGESLAILDNYQQLNLVIADLDGDPIVSNCFDTYSP